MFFLTGSAMAHCFSQNYISGTVSLHGFNTAGETTIAPGATLFLYKVNCFSKEDLSIKEILQQLAQDSGTLVLTGTSTQTLTGRFTIGSVQLDNASGASIIATEPNTMITILDSLSFW